MEPTIIAASVVTLLSPYLKKTVEEFAGEAGKKAFDKAGQLFSWIKSKVTGEAATTLTRFEKDPDRYQPFLEDVLSEQLAQDAAFRDELAAKLENIKAEAPTVEVVIRMKEAEKVTGIRIKNMTRGTAKATLDIEKGKDITGAEIDNM